MVRLSKKYYQTRCEEKEDELREARKVITEKDQVIRFLLEEPNPYRIKITSADWCWGTAPGSKSRLEYIDGHGIYHNYIRNCSASKLEVLSTDKDTAVLKLETVSLSTDKDTAVLKLETVSNHYTYWILNKANETTTEISVETLQKICDCEIASLISDEMRRLIKHV